MGSGSKICQDTTPCSNSRMGSQGKNTRRSTSAEPAAQRRARNYLYLQYRSSGASKIAAENIGHPAQALQTAQGTQAQSAKSHVQGGNPRLKPTPKRWYGKNKHLGARAEAASAQHRKIIPGKHEAIQASFSPNKEIAPRHPVLMVTDNKSHAVRGLHSQSCQPYHKTTAQRGMGGSHIHAHINQPPCCPCTPVHAIVILASAAALARKILSKTRQIIPKITPKFNSISKTPHNPAGATRPTFGFWDLLPGFQATIQGSAPPHNPHWLLPTIPAALQLLFAAA